MSATAARDYMYGRLEELGRLILSERGARREEAKKERDFLAVQLEKAVRKGRGTVALDPALEGAIRGQARGVARADPPRTIFPKPPDKTRAGTGPEGWAENAAPKSAGRPPYWGACEKLPFGELLGFVEGGLRALRGGEDVGDGPRSEEDFLELLGLLRAKAGGGALPAGSTPLNRATAPDGGFALSEDLRALRDECDRLRAEAERLRREGGRARSARFHEAGARRCREQADAWEAEERRERDERRRVRLRERSSGRAEAPTPATLPPDLSGTVRRVERDIERAFGAGGPLGPPGDLPWELLPPGQLTPEGVRAHYERLARAYPERGYLPERMVKARSLGPKDWWKGSKGFRGYVLFEFAGTERVLLECPVYGNAIYVLGEDWRALSRRSKGAVMASKGTERIPHSGEWFERAKVALGIR